MHGQDSLAAITASHSSLISTVSNISKTPPATNLRLGLSSVKYSEDRQQQGAVAATMLSHQIPELLILGARDKDVSDLGLEGAPLDSQVN